MLLAWSFSFGGEWGGCVQGTGNPLQSNLTSKTEGKVIITLKLLQKKTAAICYLCWCFSSHFRTGQIKTTKFTFQLINTIAFGKCLSFCCYHIAYFLVHSRPNSLYLSRSFLNVLAISGTSGSSGLGSVRSDEMDSRTATDIMQRWVTKCTVLHKQKSRKVHSDIFLCLLKWK